MWFPLVNRHTKAVWSPLMAQINCTSLCDICHTNMLVPFGRLGTSILLEVGEGWDRSVYFSPYLIKTFVSIRKFLKNSLIFSLRIHLHGTIHLSNQITKLNLPAVSRCIKNIYRVP